MSFPSFIDVPIEFQEDDFTCVPVCIKMILEHIRQINPGGFIPVSTLKEISLAMGTDELGTPLSGTEGINEMLRKAHPSLEFEGKTNCTLSDIEKEIQSGKPVVAFLKMPYPHSILVTGISKETLTVYYNDPQKGKREIEMGEFMSC
jgi:hypothetical protein